MNDRGSARGTPDGGAACPAAIPVMRPRLPGADALLPYLRRLDSARWYSNFGPLVQELEARLTAHWRLPPGGVLSLSNATQGLSVALQAVGAPPGSLCLMPAWTFVATAHAAIQAHLRPYLADVDETGGMLTPALAEAALAAAPGPVGAIMPVCPFGAPLDWDGWARFQQRTGIPVIIDAAAAFDSVRPGPVPAIISLHATKTLGAGEGALLLCADTDLVARARARSNFGFLGNHISHTVATNAKMSEYHAAVALAALDQWPETRRLWQVALERVRNAAAALGDIHWPAGLADDYVCSSPTIRVKDAAAMVVTLRQDGIEARKWWQDGLASHPAFAQCDAMPLPVTARLAHATLALPCWLDLDDAVAERLARSLARHGQG